MHRGINRRGNYGHRENEFHRVGAMRAFELWGADAIGADERETRASVSAKPWGSRSPLSKRPCWRPVARGRDLEFQRRDARGVRSDSRWVVQRAKNNFRVSGGLGQPEGWVCRFSSSRRSVSASSAADVLGRAQLERETVDQPSQDEEERFQRFDGVSNSIAAKKFLRWRDRMKRPGCTAGGALPEASPSAPKRRTISSRAA